MVPYSKMKIENTAGEINTLDLYVYNEVYDMPGESTGPDDIDDFIERYYVNVNDGENFMMTQHILAKKFLWSYPFFFK